MCGLQRPRELGKWADVGRKKLCGVSALRGGVLYPSVLGLSASGVQRRVRGLSTASVSVCRISVVSNAFMPGFNVSIHRLRVVHHVASTNRRGLISYRVVIVGPRHCVGEVTRTNTSVVCVRPRSRLVPSTALRLVRLRNGGANLVLGPYADLRAIGSVLPVASCIVVVTIGPNFTNHRFVPCAHRGFVRLSGCHGRGNLGCRLVLSNNTAHRIVTSLCRGYGIRNFILNGRRLFFRRSSCTAYVSHVHAF